MKIFQMSRRFYACVNHALRGVIVTLEKSKIFNLTSVKQLESHHVSIEYKTLISVYRITSTQEMCILPQFAIMQNF